MHKKETNITLHNNDYEIALSLINSLKNTSDIDSTLSADIDNAMFFLKLKHRTLNLKPCSSPFLRLIELLHLFSIDMNNFFYEHILLFNQEYKLDDNLLEKEISIQRYFLYDLLRYNTNHKSIKKFYSTLVSVLNNRNFCYNKVIDSFMHDLEQLIINDSNAEIVLNYESYKSFFINFFDKANALINKDYKDQYYYITVIQLYKFGISFQRIEFISDIWKDERDKYFSLKNNFFEMTKEYILKSIDKYLSYSDSSDFKDTFASVRENWDLVCKLCKNKELSQYLFSLILNPDIQRESVNKVFNQISQIESTIIMRRAVNYSYLLTYKKEQCTRVNPITIHRFFETQIEENLSCVLFCISNIVPLAVANEKHFELLFYYACTLRE